MVRPLKAQAPSYSLVNKASQAGMTLFEIIIVIALIGAALAAVGTSMMSMSETEVAIRLGQLAGDIRSAYDNAVLSNRPHRLVFSFVSGNYHLEVADRQQFYLADAKLDSDPTAEDEANAISYFDERFADLEALAGEEVVDPDTEEVIKPSSPVVKAKDALRPIVWTKVDNIEWGDRSIGPELLIQSMQAEHHENVQTLDDLGPQAHGVLYFFPQGYVEKAMIQIAYNDGQGRPLTSKLPYTVITEPYAGVAQVLSGAVEVDIHGEDD